MKRCLVVMVLCLMGCAADQGDGVVRQGLSVVCTTGMVGDMVKQIAGDRAVVTSLMGPGVDPHYYKATRGDLGKLSGADVIFYNGLFLEGKMEDIFEKMARSKNVVAVSRDLPQDGLRRPEGGGGQFDPHIWFDVSLWMETIDVVVDALSDADPVGAETFRENGEAYRRVLMDLHAWTREQIHRIPEGQRVLVTAHDAFGYFGQAYDIDVRGLQGVSTVAEYGVNDVSQLVDFIASRRIKAIFVESSVPDRSIQAVREGCRARGWDVAIGGTLYSDAMGPEGSGADTYVGMVQSNVNTIVEALK